MDDNIDPLTPLQQIFLQRILAAHVLTDKQAHSLFNELLQSIQQQNRPNTLGRDLNDALSRINRSLKPAFRLEIKSVSLQLPMAASGNNDGNSGDEDDNEHVQDSQTSRSSGSGSGSKSTVYHAIVNCDSDDVAKTHANPTFTKSPHELAFFRLLLERFVEKDATADENAANNTNHRRGKGCASFMSRMDMINLRLELSGAHKDKLNITQVENVLDLMEVQGWLVPACPSAAVDEGDGGMSSTPENSRRRKRGGAGSGNDDGGSKYLQIGPRSYLEFTDFLTKAGLENDRLPQFLLHG